VATADLAETAAIGIVAAATTVADAAETVADAAEIVPAVTVARAAKAVATVVTVARAANASPARAAATKAPSRRLLQRSLPETTKIKRHPGLRAGTHLT
jgi:uncharacterized protein YbjT (DUF2867 family)